MQIRSHTTQYYLFFYPGYSKEYRIGRLEPQHAELVASKYPYKGKNIAAWIEDLILKYPSAAAYWEKDPSQPVSWALQYENGETGSGYTLELHRKKGLTLAIFTTLCYAIVNSGQDIPCYYVVNKGPTLSFLERHTASFIYSGSEVYYAEKN